MCFSNKLLIFRSLSPHSNTRPRHGHGPRSPPPKIARAPAPITSKRAMPSNHVSATSSRAPHSRGEEKQKLPPIKHRVEDKVILLTAGCTALYIHVVYDFSRPSIHPKKYYAQNAYHVR